MKTLREYIEQAIRESAKIPMDNVYIETMPPSDWNGIAYLVVRFGQTSEIDAITRDGGQTTPVQIYSVSNDQWESEQLCRQVAGFVESKINEWSQDADCPLVGMVPNPAMTYDDKDSSVDTGNTIAQKITEMNFNVIHHITS